jgi:hypothetical protein
MVHTRADIHGPFDAIGIRGDHIGRHSEFGLYGTDSRPVPDADIAGSLFTSGPKVKSPGDTPAVEVTEPVLFAGLVPQQFGHVILNSLGRLWALDQLPRETGLLYLPRRRSSISHYPYLLPLLELLGIRTRTLLHRRPTRYRSLFTAADLFGERHGGAMDPKMRAWLDRRLPPAGSITRGRRVYLTRSRLGPQAGRFCNEEHLERLLAADGYEIVAPERLSLADQVTLFQTAELLLFAESSALHLYGLVQREGQRAAVIQRRRSLPALIEGQLRGGPAAFHAIEAIQSVHWPPRREDNISIATLDFGRLGEALVATGFLSAQAQWHSPGMAEVAASLHAGLDPGVTLVPDEKRRDWLRQSRRRTKV